jgi:hypothetical protein
MYEREQELHERWHVAMQQYWISQLQISREHLLSRDGAPTPETMRRADAARKEAAEISRQLARAGEHPVQTVESLRHAGHARGSRACYEQGRERVEQPLYDDERC